jgi:hypothetical protein
MGRLRARRPPVRDLDTNLSRFADMLDGWISYGTVARAAPMMDDGQYARLQAAVAHVQASMLALQRQLTSARSTGGF